MSAGGDSGDRDDAPHGVDHLVYTVPVLEQGMDHIEHLLGVRPVVGGRHPGLGTHNALLSLGPATYLEVVAPDPSLPRPARGLVFGMDGITESSLATWALRREDVEAGALAAASAGVDLGAVQDGSRVRTDGVHLSWKLTDPHAMPCGGVVPFLIGWGDTPHPAASAPQAGALLEVTVEHPDAGRVRSVLEALDAPAVVKESVAPKLRALIAGPAGEVEL